MVFAPVDPAVREKIIAAYLSGKGRNQIDRELHEDGVKVSHGSISNIINAYKHEHEQPLQPQSPQTLSPQPEADAGISNGVPMNNIDGSSLLIARSGIGRAVSTTNSSSVTPRNGGPLSYFLFEDDLTEEEVIAQSNSPPKLDLPKSRDLLIKDPEVNIEPDANVININPEEFEQYQPPSLPKDTPTSIGVNWDSEENHQRRFWARVLEEKEEKRKVLQLIEKKTHELNQERQNLAQARFALEEQKEAD